MPAPPEAPPLVSVAILAYNRRDELALTLDKTLTELRYPRERLEVIVVDNASDDGTAEMVRSRFPDVRVIQTDRNEGIPAWNRAFEAGRGDWFLVLDDDCYIEGDALERALEEAERHDADLVSFRVESSDPGHAFTDAYPTGLLAFWGCSVLVNARAMRTLRGYDPGIFLYNHELEFMVRFFDAGFRHLMLTDVSSFHMKPLPSAREETYVRNVENFAYVATKLLRPRDAAVALANLATRSALEGAVQRRVPPSLAGLGRGARRGVQARRPVRPPVSRLYRRNYVEYANPLRFAPRSPREVWSRVRGIPPAADAQSGVADPRAAFWAQRSRLYPAAPAALRVP